MFKILLLLLQVLFVYELYGFEIFNGINFIETSNAEFLKENKIEEHYFRTQRLNHFNKTDVQRWQQRYFINNSTYKSGGPVFLIIAEGDAWKTMMNSLEWINIAEDYGAVCIYLEHRYYGSSYPTGDYSTNNLKYLNSQQALADIAEFIVHINWIYSLDAKWIAVGDSYAGSLAAWMRLKYPHLVYGAVAKDAHLRPTLNHSDYFKKLGELYDQHNQTCKNAIKDAFSELNLLLQDRIGQEKVRETLHLVKERFNEPEFTSLDINLLNYKIANFFSSADIKTDDRHAFLEFACNIMTNEKLETPLKRLAAYVKTQQDLYKPYNILYTNGYNAILERLSNSDRVADSYNLHMAGSRQNLYRACTEFGLFRSSDDSSHVFGNGFPLNFFKQVCIDVFGYISENMEYKQQLRYGGTKINVTNVFYQQYDPLMSLGIPKHFNPTSPVVIMTDLADRSEIVKNPQFNPIRKMIAAQIETLLKS